jgi:hypothetical protein
MHYRGIVWCLRVPTGAFVARRNGQVFVTGNSGFPKSHNLSKAADRKAGVDRPVVGEMKLTGTARIIGGQGGASAGRAEELYTTKQMRDTLQITAPATEDARRFDGYGTALKPATEPAVLAYKPFRGTILDNMLQHGCGALAIDACRIGSNKRIPASKPQRGGAFEEGGWKGDLDDATGHDPNIGRWPANFVLSHTEDCVEVGVAKVKAAKNNGTAAGVSRNGTMGDFKGTAKAFDYADADGTETVPIWECSPDCPVAMLDAQSGDRPTSEPGTVVRRSQNPAQIYGDHTADVGRTQVAYGDVGGASRFFYCAKVSKRERCAGTDHLEKLSCTFKPWEGADQLAVLLVDTGSSPPMVIGASGIPGVSVTEWNTLLFGSGPTDPCLQGCRFIIATRSSSTTESRTLSWLTQQRTSVFTAAASSETVCGGSPAVSASSSSPSPKSTGTSREDGPTTTAAGPATLRSWFERSRSVELVATSASDHPTLKPIELATYYAKLILPPPGPTPRRILVPFSGAGSEVIGALLAGWDEVVGVEVEDSYIEIADARIEFWVEQGRGLKDASAKGRGRGAGREVEFNSKTRECRQCGSRRGPSSPGGAWPACGHDDWVWMPRKPVTAPVVAEAPKPAGEVQGLVVAVQPAPAKRRGKAPPAEGVGALAFDPMALLGLKVS